MQFVDVKNDVAFRKIFGNENRKESLISFLNAILAFEGSQRIADVTILNPYQLPKLKGGKVTIVDIKATDKMDRTYIIEMQVAELEGFDKRVLYYFAKSYSDQIKRGDFYRQLKPVILIAILDFVYTKNPNFLNRSQVRDVETGEKTIQDVEFNFIELPKFDKKLKDLKTLTDKWVYFIKNAENIDVVPENTDDEGLMSAYQEANKQTWTKQELDAYDYVFMREEDDRARMDAATKKANLAAEKAMALLAEAEKATAEAEKATAEAEKATAEAEKATAEAEKATAEAEKATAEAEKKAADAKKATAEAEKKAADAKKATAEAEKKAVEAKNNEKIDIAKKMIAAGSDNEFIAQVTSLTIEQIQLLRL